MRHELFSTDEPIPEELLQETVVQEGDELDETLPYTEEFFSSLESDVEQVVDKSVAPKQNKKKIYSKGQVVNDSDDKNGSSVSHNLNSSKNEQISSQGNNALETFDEPIEACTPHSDMDSQVTTKRGRKITKPKYLHSYNTD